MEKAYKYRLYPNKQQKELINKTFGCVRYVYNYYLAKRKEVYDTDKTTYSFYYCCKDLTLLKQELSWLQEPDKSALQNTLRDLDNTFKRFFTEQNYNYPKFKKKKGSAGSYRSSCNNNNIEFLGNKIKLPKLGKVKIKGGKLIPEGRILNATISKSPSGKYYVSLCCTDVEIKPFEKTGNQVGIDLGIIDYCSLSNGEKYENPKYLECSQEKLVKAQRSLDRKTRGSKRWEKQRIKVAKIHEKIANQRKDYLYKLSTTLVKENDLLCMETLHPDNLKKNHKLSQAIIDASWGRFIKYLEYKVSWHNRELIYIDRFFASSQICSVCGFKNKRTKDLRVREWTCPSCRTVHDRDINASINILHEGLRMKNNC